MVFRMILIVSTKLIIDISKTIYKFIRPSLKISNIVYTVWSFESKKLSVIFSDRSEQVVGGRRVNGWVESAILYSRQDKQLITID